MFAFCSRPGRFRRIENSLLIAMLCGMATTASLGQDPKNVSPKQVPVLKVPVGWNIEIIPGPAIGPSPVPKAQLAARQAAQAETKPAALEANSGVVTAGAESAFPAGITPAAYAEVYNSIQFRRSEYLANPSYRHEATVEILLGQVRPKTVTNVSAPPAATCCSPRAVSYVGLFNPWGAKNFYYHYSYSRPSSYWLW